MDMVLSFETVDHRLLGNANRESSSSDMCVAGATALHKATNQLEITTTSTVCFLHTVDRFSGFRQ